MARRAGKAKPARFKLSYVGSAKEDAKRVPARLRSGVATVVERLAAEGCRAADYALSGEPPWPHLCALHVEDWRILVAFPAEDEVTILKIAPHGRSSDPYREIAGDLGISVSDAPRTKPPCCEPSGEPPVDADLVEKVDAAFKDLSQRERRRRSRSTR